MQTSNDVPPSPAFPRQRDWVILAVLALALLTFALGRRGLNEPDEGRYASIALNMVQSGDWWEPRLSGFGHYDKPPLVYWATALSLRGLGRNEWAARLPSLLGAVCALLGLGWAAWRLRGAKVAWWAVLICVTTTQFWLLGRVLSPDMLLAGWCSLAIAAWAECRHRDGARPFWWLSLFFWSLAWWTKATPALIPLAGLAAGLRLTGDARGWRALRLWWLLPAIVALGSPWYLSMLHRYPELRSFFFGRELAGRMVGRIDGRHGSAWYYLPVSLCAWLPWWPVAAWMAWRERARWFGGSLRTRWRQAGQLLGLEGWLVVVGLALLSLASSKLPTYSLPLCPWACLGFACLVAPKAALHPRGYWALAAVFAAVASTSIVFLPPRYESRLKVNSSLREVCRYLQAQHARRVDVDRYWGGMEFYLGRNVVHYAVRIDPGGSGDALPQPRTKSAKNIHHRERSTDGGQFPARFIDSRLWPVLPDDASPQSYVPGDGWWLVRFGKQQYSCFNDLVRLEEHVGSPFAKPVRIGHFLLYRMPPAP